MSRKRNVKVTGRDAIMACYMAYALEKRPESLTVDTVCEDTPIAKEDFLMEFETVAGMECAIWESRYEKTITQLNTEESYKRLSPREKLITFYCTFFQLLTLHRNYILLSLGGSPGTLKTAPSLRVLRDCFKSYAMNLVKGGAPFVNHRHPALFAEAAWLQFLFILRYWMEDTSQGFERTRIAIGRSVNTAFEVFRNTPHESVMDFGRFLQKERMW